MKKTNLLASMLCTGIILTGQGFSKSPSSDMFCDTVPAKGSHSVILPIKTWGRYSIRSSCAQPVALSIADRRSGVLLRDGISGERNGRLDLFLEIGDYKITTQGPKNAAASAAIIVEPFKFPPDFKPAYLIPLKENQLEIRDVQQCAFWFEAAKDTTVYIEASGRYLGDLRLWRDGEWLVQSRNSAFVARPKVETPLSGIALTATIPKGNYMLAAYGGQGKDWALKNDNAPLYVQMGLETLDANVTTIMTIPAKGYVRFMLTKQVNTLVVEEPQRSSLYVETTGGADSICAKSSAPRIMLSCTSGGSVRISGAAGQTFTVETFGPYTDEIIGNGAAWWISSQHSGYYGDQIGVSGFIVEHEFDNNNVVRNSKIVALCADTISNDRELAKRFNFLSETGLTSYVWVESEASYWLSQGGTGFMWRIAPVFTSLPPNYKAPEFQEGSGSINLNRGLYVLELNPKKRGIASIVIQKTSLLGSVFKTGKEVMLGHDDNRTWTAPLPSIQFSAFPTVNNRRYSIHINRLDPELSTVSCRQLPIDPDSPLGVWSRPGDNLLVTVRLHGRRALRLIDTGNTAVLFTIQGKQYDKTVVLDSGEYTVGIPASGRAPRRHLLASLRPESMPAIPPPPFPDEKRLSLSKFPVIAQEKTVYLDLDRAGARPYALNIDEPGIYRIETTGRLSTRLTIHDRFFNFVRNAEGNGVGRNAMLIEYLLKGGYQLDVGAVGQSAGHLGLAAYHNQLIQGAALKESIDNRAMVPAYSGIAYPVHITEQGQYRLESIGQNGNFPFRLEDLNGWPLEPAISTGKISTALDKGDYRLISLPAMQDGRRITRLTRASQQRTLTGKGPHRLEINEPLSLIWENGPDTAAATFLFSLVSPISATLTISGGFTAALYKKGADSAITSWTTTKRMDLAAGEYRLCMRPLKKRNLAPYQVSVSTRDLIAGLSYTLTKPQMLRVSVGAAGAVQIGSQGMLDVAATLYESDAKTVIASNDDGFLDWNFAISRVLKPGRYFLRVESVEPGFTATSVFMRSLTDTLMNPVSCIGGQPATVQCELTQRLAIFPLAVAESCDVLSCALKASQRCGLAVEKRLPGVETWVGVAQDVSEAPMISIPRDFRSAYRVKVWSENVGEQSFTLSCFSTKAKSALWREAASGLTGQAVAVGGDYCSWFKLDLSAAEAKAPGHYRVFAGKDPLSAIGVSIAADTSFWSESASWFSATKPFVWVEFHCEQAGRFSARLEPMELEKQTQIITAFTGNRPRVFAARQSAAGVLFLTAESDGQHPLVAIASKATSRIPPFSIRGIPVSQDLWIGRDRCAAAMLPGDESRVAIWNSLPPIDQTRPPVTITCKDLPLTDGGALPLGASGWVADAAGARVVHIAQSAGPVCIRVVLPPRCAAQAVRRDGTRTLECNVDDEPGVRELYVDKGDFYCFALTANVRFDMTALSADSSAFASRQLTPGKSWQEKRRGDGVVFLPLSAALTTSAQLFYHGAVRSVGWVDPYGALHNECGDGARIGPGGFVTIDAAQGWLKLDLCDVATPEGIMAAKWGASTAPSNSVSTDRSSIVRLGDRLNWFSFTLADTHHVSLSAPYPLAAIMLRDGKPINYQEAWELFNWDLPLTPAKYSLGIHPLSGSSIEGGQLTVLFRQIERLSEKQPYTGYLSPGESRLVRFDVQKKDRFGIGVRMAKETAQAFLYDCNGTMVAQGKQQFVELSPGTYYLWVQVPLSSEGTALTLFLFGQEAPPNQPPEKLVTWIINGAVGPRPDLTVASDDNSDEGIKVHHRIKKSIRSQTQDEGRPVEGESEGQDNGESNEPPPVDNESEGE